MRTFHEPVPYIARGATFAGQLAAGQFYTTEQQLAVFALVREQLYIDILPLQDNATFHTATASLTLTAGDFLAIRAEEDEWYRGDNIFNPRTGLFYYNEQLSKPQIALRLAVQLTNRCRGTFLRE